MKYQANPVIVDAFKIVGTDVVTNAEPPLPLKLAIDNGENVVATPEMQSRMIPKPGDYWVVQSDGYIYLNPKDVFERKYSPVAEEQAA